MRAEPLEIIGSAFSPKPALTPKQRRSVRIVLGVTVATSVLSFLFWWPTFADVCRFAFLVCFPAGLFLLGLRYSSQSRDHQLLPWLALLHCAFLGIVIYLWRVSPARLSVHNPDFVFGFEALEFAVFLLLREVDAARQNGRVTTNRHIAN